MKSGRLQALTHSLSIDATGFANGVNCRKNEFHIMHLLAFFDVLVARLRGVDLGFHFLDR